MSADREEPTKLRWLALLHLNARASKSSPTPSGGSNPKGLHPARGLRYKRMSQRNEQHQQTRPFQCVQPVVGHTAKVEGCPAPPKENKSLPYPTAGGIN